MKKKNFFLRILLVIGIIFTSLLLFLGITALIQIDFSNDADMDVFVEKKMGSAGIVGFTALAFKDGNIFWSKNYGYADKEKNRMVEDDTIFQIASVSKTITGVAVMQLIERGKIDLNGPINDYLPFDIHNPNHPDKTITMKMLLQHKSSLIDNSKVMDTTYTIESGKPDPEMSLEDFVHNYFREGGKFYDIKKNFSKKEPGKVYKYSNAVFGLLGYIVERVSGQPFNEYCRLNIFDPLGMDSTGWYTTEIDMNRMTVHYDQGKALRTYSFTTYPDGALKTTSRDFAKFITAILNGGSYEGKAILKKSSVELMLPANHEENLVWDNEVMGSLFINTDGKIVQGHNGGDPGIVTIASFDRDTKTGVIFFMNTTPALNFKVINVISCIDRIHRMNGLY